MLATLRGRATGVLIKITLGLIILSFVLFFGYTQLDPAGNGQGVAATVNGEPIPIAYWQQRLDETLAQARRNSGGTVGPEQEKYFSSNLIHQLVDDTIKIQWSKAIGLTAPRVQVAAEIIKTPALNRDGVFDETFYRTVWRGTIESQYGKDFEAMLADSLAVEKMQSVIPDYSFVDAQDAREIHRAREATIKLAVAEVTDPKKKPIFKKTEARTVRERGRLISGAVSLEDWERIMALKVGATLKGPVQAGDKSFLVKKLSQTKPRDTQWEKVKSAFIDGLVRERGDRLAIAHIDPFRKSAAVEIAKTLAEGN